MTDNGLQELHGNLLLDATGTWDDVRLLEGEQNPRAGWYSASYNKIAPAPMLSLTQEVELSHRYAVLLLPYKGTEPPETAIAFQDGTATVSIEGSDYRITSSI